jgi:hypothetical protein
MQYGFRGVVCIRSVCVSALKAFSTFARARESDLSGECEKNILNLRIT